MKKNLFTQLLLLPILFVFWYFVFPDYLWSIEANAYFVSTPDYYTLQLALPGDIKILAAHFIAQFYTWTALGALIQSLFTMLVLYASDSILYKITREKQSLWLAFIPACLFLAYQCGQPSLAYSVKWSFLFLVVGLCFTLLWRFPAWNVSGLFCFRKPICNYLFPALITGITLYSLYMREELRNQEELFRLERNASRRDWDRILKDGESEKLRQDPFKLPFVLLALSEKQLLPEQIFTYPVSSSDCFFFERATSPFSCNFNSLFYDCLGVKNEAIHQSFQAGIQAENGMTFINMRRLIDWNLHIGAIPVAEKYLKVLEHATCHQKWIDKRHAVIASYRDNSVRLRNQSNAFFIGAHPFLSDMARVVDSDTTNSKAIDYMLCGILIDKDMNKFRQALSYCHKYMNSSVLPRHYEEALLLISQQDPEILTKYPIRKERMTQFTDFLQLMKQGGLFEKVLAEKYGTTFWYYYCFAGKQK